MDLFDAVDFRAVFEGDFDEVICANGQFRDLGFENNVGEFPCVLEDLIVPALRNVERTGDDVVDFRRGV